MVAKNDLGAGGDILEAYLTLTANEMLGHAAHIARGLFREPRKGRALGLRLDDAAQRAVDEQGIVDRARRRGELAHRDARPSAKVHPVARLHQPAGLCELGVNRLSGAVLGMKNAALPAHSQFAKKLRNGSRVKIAQFPLFQ